MDCYNLWKELELRLRTGLTIDAQEQAILKNKELYWQNILERLIELVRVLGEQNLALRGSGRETLFEVSNGNFLKFVLYLGQFDQFRHKRRSFGIYSNIIIYWRIYDRNIAGSA